MVVSKEGAIKGRGIPPAFFVRGGTVRELSVFVDESGDLGGESKYYLLALVFHDQSADFSATIGQYESILRERGLDDIPLHLNPLMRANEEYANLAPSVRLRLLMAFSTFAYKSPFRYHVFAYQKDWFQSQDALGARMRRDLVEYLFDNIAWFQNFDIVKIYYDDGQAMVTRALHDGFEYALAREAVVYRDAHPANYRMLQVADYACGIELAALKYEAHEDGATDRIFFGTRRDFLKNYLRKLRKHLL